MEKSDIKRECFMSLLSDALTIYLNECTSTYASNGFQRGRVSGLLGAGLISGYLSEDEYWLWSEAVDEWAEYKFERAHKC